MRLIGPGLPCLLQLEHWLRCQRQEREHKGLCSHVTVVVANILKSEILFVIP